MFLPYSVELLTLFRFGYIDFATTEAATDAINGLHQEVFEGRRLVVQYAAYTSEQMSQRSASADGRRGDRPENPASRTLFIGNMSFELTDRDLNNLFRGIKNIVDVRVAIDRRTGQPRGFAHADFVDVESAQAAKETLGDKELYGRRLKIDFSQPSRDSPRNQRPPPTR